MDGHIAAMLAVTMIIAGIGVAAFIVVGVQNASMQKLLSEGEYTQDKKGKKALHEAVDGIYWGVLVAIYLAWSFLSNDRHITWIVFPVGGALCPVVINVFDHILNKHKDK